MFLPNDTDATFDWLAQIDLTPYDHHPVYWWEGRAQPARARPALAGGDERRRWRARYVDAIARSWRSGTSRRSRDGSTPGRSRSPPTSPPIRTAGRRAPNSRRRSQTARDVVATRAQFLQRFVDCARTARATTRDGDGVRWCNDCRDDNPAATRAPPRCAATASTTTATASPTTAAEAKASGLGYLGRQGETSAAPQRGYGRVIRPQALLVLLNYRRSRGPKTEAR